MVVLKYSLFFSALFSVHVFALSEENISFDNKLSACAQPKNWKVLSDSGIPLVSFEVELNKSIGDCGCKSALSSFRVHAKRDGYSSFLMAGKINFAKAGKKYLPLATDEKLIGSAVLEVQLSCAQPD